MLHNTCNEISHIFCECIHSGPDYLKRICKDQDGLQPVTILSASEVYVHLQENQEVNSWIGSVKVI